MWVSCQAYGLEIFSPKYRRHITCIRGKQSIIAVPICLHYRNFPFSDFPFSMYIFTAIVYFNRHWTYMHLSIGILTLLSLPIWFFLPESPRWLASNNKKDEAQNIFLNIAKTNGKSLTLEEKMELSEILETVRLPVLVM